MNCRNCGQALDEASRFCKFCGASVPPDPDEAAAPIKLGDVLEGKWRIEKKIGQGGMGSVYVAQDVSLDRKVAIKILAPDLCNDQEFVARFEREAKGTANLEHPNVVLVYAVGQHFGRPFIVMKYLEGQSLARHLKHAQGGLPLAEVVGIFTQLLSGMGFIHAKGFIHRDIKSGNIFIGPDGKTTILDFGILRDTRSNQGLTRVGVVMGTPHYLAPEQALGKNIDHRADLYAVGVLLYECLTGKPPYEADTARKLIEMHLKSPVPDPCSLLADLPVAMGAAVRKSLGKKAEDRFQTAVEMSEAIQAAFASASQPAVEEVGEQPDQGPAPVVDEEEARPTRYLPTKALKRAELVEEKAKATRFITDDALPPPDPVTRRPSGRMKQQPRAPLEIEPPEAPVPRRSSGRMKQQLQQSSSDTLESAPALPRQEPAQSLPPTTQESPVPTPHKSRILPLFVIVMLVVMSGMAWKLYLAKELNKEPTGSAEVGPAKPQPNPAPTPPTEPVKPKPPEDKFKKHLAEGQSLASKKAYAMALGPYIQAEEIDPKNPVLLYEMGVAYLGTREYDNALRYFGKTIQADPNNQEARLGIVRTYAASKKVKEAVGELKAMVEGGYKDLATLEADEALEPVRDDPGWAEIKRVAQGGAVAVANPHPTNPTNPTNPRPPDKTPDKPRTDKPEALVMGATGELKVSVNPADPPATVKIDGRPRGPTPLSAELNAGKHTVVIERPGSKKYTKQVKVPLAGIFTLNADLEPE